jgi:hypothetical protein
MPITSIAQSQSTCLRTHALCRDVADDRLDIDLDSCPSTAEAPRKEVHANALRPMRFALNMGQVLPPLSAFL